MGSRNIPVNPIHGEEWRDVPSAPGYMVSDLGRVMRKAGTGRGIPHDRLMQPRLNDSGYLVAMLTLPSGKAKPVRVHRLVTEAFIRPMVGDEVVNHLDGDKTNNVPHNLEVTDRAGNSKHAVEQGLIRSGGRHGMAKLTDEKVRAIRADFDAGATGLEIAAKYGISRNYAYQIKRQEERSAA